MKRKILSSCHPVTFLLLANFIYATILTIETTKERVTMNCPNCGKWNPEDKEICWRCQTPLPKPEPKKPKRQNIAGFPIWMWVALILFFLATTLGQCFMSGGLGR